MPAGELYLRRGGSWVDAYTEYGLSLEDEGLSRLMTPAPQKEPVQNKNMAMNGTAIKGGVGYKDVRTLSLPIHILAPTRESFFSQYWKFCNEILDTGWVHVRHSALSGVEFHFRYVDCQQCSVYHRKMAKLTLSLEEPNPNNRT